jgi:hypothetical protein
MTTKRPTTYRPECGTREGFKAHSRAGEKACQPCRKAIAIGFRDESTMSLEHALGELSALRQGRKFWNPNIFGQR